MVKPIRIKRSRQMKQVSPNGLPIVYVGRPSKWGNPFIDLERQNAVNWFVAWLNRKYFINKCAPTDEEIQKELKGKNLSCWCKVGEPCHADILLKIANSNA